MARYFQINSNVPVDYSILHLIKWAHSIDSTFTTRVVRRVCTAKRLLCTFEFDWLEKRLKVKMSELNWLPNGNWIFRGQKCAPAVAASITWAQAEANPVRMMDHLVAVISLSFDLDPFWCCQSPLPHTSNQNVDLCDFHKMFQSDNGRIPRFHYIPITRL